LVGIAGTSGFAPSHGWASSTVRLGGLWQLTAPGLTRPEAARRCLAVLRLLDATRPGRSG